MDLHLKNKVALVTGGSRGIGRGVVEGLAAEGAHVVTCARTADALDKAVEEMREGGLSVEGIVADISENSTADQLVDEIVSKHGKLDVLVNSAGGNRRGIFDELSDDDWEELLNLNLKSHIRMSRAAVRQMKKQQSGSIVFISSIFGRESGGSGLAIYNTTKSALISLAKIMALDHAKDGIRVNTVAPGSIRFPGGSWDKRCINDPEGMATFIETNLPLGRFGSVEEVANLVTFLASDRASLLTGTCITADGSQSKSLI